VSKSLIWALVLIAVSVLFFIFSGGSTTIEFFSFSMKVKTSIALLSFTGVGVAIGVLLK